ncbi:hypothetical protein NMY22_g3110 [Coprinellus aureogranulatus]|nr:hypothetical protein NMY22_g3110 [Coprinellus aureogranulatus]
MLACCFVAVSNGGHQFKYRNAVRAATRRTQVPSVPPSLRHPTGETQFCAQAHSPHCHLLFRYPGTLTLAPAAVVETLTPMLAGIGARGLHLVPAMPFSPATQVLLSTRDPHNVGLHRDDVSQRIAELKDEIQALEGYYNNLAWPNRLPPEILSRIFIIVASYSKYKDENDYDTNEDLKWIRVTHVCRYWRETASNCVALWSQLSFVNPQFTEFMIDKSRNAPLSIECGWRHGAGKFQDVLCKALSRTTQLRQVTLASCFASSHPLDIPPLLALLSGCLPILEEIFLYTSRDEPTALPTRFLDETAPNLKSLKLIRISVGNWTNLPLRSTLTRLHLESTGPSDPAQPSWVQLFEALQIMPGLESLTLERFLPNGALPSPLPLARGAMDSINLRKLRSLKLVDFGSSVGHFCTVIQFPIAEEVHLSSLDAQDTAFARLILHKLLSSWRRLSAELVSNLDYFGHSGCRFAFTFHPRIGASEAKLTLSFAQSSHITAEILMATFREQMDFSGLTFCQFFPDPTLTKETWITAFGGLKKLRYIRFELDDDRLSETFAQALSSTNNATPAFPALSNLCFMYCTIDEDMASLLISALQSRPLTSPQLEVNFYAECYFKKGMLRRMVDALPLVRVRKHCRVECPMPDDSDGDTDLTTDSEGSQDSDDSDDDMDVIAATLGAGADPDDSEGDSVSAVGPMSSMTGAPATTSTMSLDPLQEQVVLGAEDIQWRREGIRQRILDLKKEITTLEGHYNSLSGPNRIPPEILSNIFMLVARHSKRRFYSDDLDCIRVTHIEGCPLSIECDWNGGKFHDVLCRALSRTEQLRSIILTKCDKEDPEPMQLETLLTVMSGPAPALEHLRLYAMTGTTPVPLPRRFLGGTAPNLKTFSLGNIDVQKWGDMPLRSTLTCLELEDKIISIPGRTRDTNPARPTWTQLLTALQEMPSLRTLTLEAFLPIVNTPNPLPSTWNPNSRVELHQLQFLSLTDFGESIEALLGVVHIPEASEIRAYFKNVRDVSFLRRFMQTLSDSWDAGLNFVFSFNKEAPITGEPRLEISLAYSPNPTKDKLFTCFHEHMDFSRISTIELSSDPKLTTATWITVFGGSKTLRAIRFDEDSFSKAFVEALCSTPKAHRSSPVFPALRSLEFVNHIFDTHMADLLITALKSRQSLSLSPKMEVEFFPTCHLERGMLDGIIESLPHVKFRHHDIQTDDSDEESQDDDGVDVSQGESDGEEY